MSLSELSYFVIGGSSVISADGIFDKCRSPFSNTNGSSHLL
jgi:hypothetical protein